MSTPLMQWNPELLVLVLAASTVGILSYLALRLLESRAPLFVVLLGLLSAFFLVDFCQKLDPDITRYIPSASTAASLFFAVWVTGCIVMGAKFHRSLSTSSGSIFNYFLMAASVTAAILWMSGLWDSQSRFFGLGSYSVGTRLKIPAFYFCLFFCSFAPAATAFLLYALMNSQLRPGIDRHLKKGEGVER